MAVEDNQAGSGSRSEEGYAAAPKTPEHVEHGYDPGLEAYDTRGLAGLLRSPFVFGAALLASLGGFSFGYDQGVISLILTMPQFERVFPEIVDGHSRAGFNKGFMTGMLDLGAFVGCLFLPLVADRFSRKVGLAVATTFFCIGAIIQTASTSYGMVVAGRTIGGVGVGTLAMDAPLYIFEVAPPHLRGSLLVLEQFSIVAYWITDGTRRIPGEWAFRLPFLLQMAPALLVGVGIQFFPFSPRWLAMRHRDDDSLRALERLRRLPASDPRVRHEWSGILREVRVVERAIELDHGPHVHPLRLECLLWADLFRPQYLRRTVVAVAIPFFQQFSGINAFVYYAPTFFAALGQSYERSLVLSGVVNVFQLVACVPTFLFLDRLGRRKLAILGSLLMGAPHFVMAGIVGKFSSSWAQHQGAGWFGVGLIYIYVAAYGFTYGPLAWALPAEVFPNSKRAKGVSAATCVNWLSNFVIGVVVPEMQLKLGWGTYLFFGCFCLAASVFSFLFVPETSGKTLEEIAGLFGDRLDEEERELVAQVR